MPTRVIDGRGVVILSNTAADADDLGFATLEADAPLEPTYKATRSSGPLRRSAITSANIGSNSGAAVDFTVKGDHLEAQITGGLTVQIFASAKDKFFLTIFNDSNATRDVVAMVLHQSGGDLRATRVTTQR